MRKVTSAPVCNPTPSTLLTRQSWRRMRGRHSLVIVGAAMNSLKVVQASHLYLRDVPVWRDLPCQARHRQLSWQSRGSHRTLRTLSQVDLTFPTSAATSLTWVSRAQCVVTERLCNAYLKLISRKPVDLKFMDCEKSHWQTFCWLQDI